MSATSCVPSFGSNLYNKIVKNSVSYSICNDLMCDNIGVLAINYYDTRDTRNVIIIKALATKVAMLPLFCLASIESLSRLALGLTSYFFSLATFFYSPLSNGAYNFAKDLIGTDLSFRAINSSFFSFFFW